MSLLGDKVEDFEYFVRWLYHPTDEVIPKSEPEQIRLLVQQYILADKYDVPELRMRSIDTIIAAAMDGHRPHLNFPTWGAIR